MNKNRLQSVFFIVLVALLLFVSTVGAAPKDGPVVSLGTAQSEFSAAQDVLVTVTISNPTRHSVRILKWFTPIEGVVEPVFTVKVNGKAASYTGAIYKRPAPTGSDYLTLKSGESVTYQVNLGDTYDLSATGLYTIFYSAASYNLFNEKASSLMNADSLASGSISIKIEGRTAKGKPPPPPPPPPGGNSFNACSVSQQAILINARNQAKIYASDSKSYLGSHNSSTARYTEWFGIFTTIRHDLVTTHFTANVRLARQILGDAEVTFTRRRDPIDKGPRADDVYAMNLAVRLDSAIDQRVRMVEGVAAVVCLAATVVTPFGPAVWGYVASLASNPIIAGQHPEYLAKQLGEFKSGKRNNPVMKGFATTLSDSDVRNVAAFYAGKSLSNVGQRASVAGAVAGAIRPGAATRRAVVPAGIRPRHCDLARRIEHRLPLYNGISRWIGLRAKP